MKNYSTIPSPIEINEKTKIMKDYYVTYRVIGEQITLVKNCKNKAEAKRKVLARGEDEGVDFRIIRNLFSTMEVFDVRNLMETKEE